MKDSAVVQLDKLQKEPEKILNSVEQNFNPAEIAWKSARRHNCRIMNGMEIRGKPSLTVSGQWKSEMFYVSVDEVSNGIFLLFFPFCCFPRFLQAMLGIKWQGCN